MTLGIVSLNVGTPVTVEYQGKDLSTGIYKQPVDGPLFLSTVNFAGDGQADLVNHGGVDKAVCAYPYEHYAYWENSLGKQLPYAAFGENLTLRGMLEDRVCIGDVYRVGDAVVQISQPRYPCFKLSQKLGVKDMPVRVLNTGYSGFYFRVLEEGDVRADSSVTQLESHAAGATVLEVLRMMKDGRKDEQGLNRMLELDVLSVSLKTQFGKWLEALQSRTD
ncbi:MOSC domain-containing protein [Paenibacillus glucanolyticus]|jgi:MOSC domain-containing protein YiiM|uniref:MOSC domain-containing protein n=1 Tax=Paenibacillus TaxID=44249 RepID=UPI0003E20CF1|nr:MULTISPECIES: MOSC domain-containing protein [Paenibacillus]ANA79849.1 sulfurase [Paenibacillus glucanolyticus]AVV56126.1 MOSC domain-containing protein [Paenibacillus glucanolyticus]ETT38229.1 MOSC domain-containing protein [Paenibacillus sp. FSL R5-808]MPY20184.1 MOSC domain-containing protein [Paenibacillus glucanolyticus]